jgi:fatty-acyl-CoA synthase
VTHTAGVPTVWLMLLQHMAKEKLTLPDLKMVVCGGSAMPRSMIQAFLAMGCEARHAWGMTEMSPIGTLAALKPPCDQLRGEARIDVLASQGYPVFGVQMKITDDAGHNVPWDGKTFGRLKVSGPAVAKAYFKVDSEILDPEGFFDTGDVATVDQNAYMRITDRSKDVIKSGGEWISSIDLENLAVGHPKVAEAAVIGVYHPKWDERPLLIVQLKADQTCTREEILHYMDGKIAKWWMPDDVIFIEAIPHTATGKILKTALRDQFKTYAFPTAAA